MIIVRFALEWEALSTPGQEPYQRVATCRRIVDFWDRHGVLVFLGGNDGKFKDLESLDRMPQSARKLWKEAFKRLRSRSIVTDGASLSNLLEPQHLSSLAGCVDLLGADSDRCSLLGLGQDDVSVQNDVHAIEIVRIHDIDQAQCVALARESAIAEIRRNQTAEQLWADRVAELAKLSKEFVVVDRYCGVDLARCSGSAISGLEFVLRKVWDKELAVRVYMATPRKVRDVDYLETLDHFKTSVREVLAKLLLEIGPRTRDLVLYRMPDKAFGDISHDRYIRCDSWLLKFDVGLEPFSASGKRRTRSAFEMRSCTGTALAEKSKIERLLRSGSDGVIQLSAGVEALDT